MRNSTVPSPPTPNASDEPASATIATAPVTAEPKPKLRGWLHAATVPLLGAGIIVLICVAPSAGVKAALAIYLGCALLLFGNSATYHIGNWSATTKAVLRRIDHSNIYLFVAGTYTPLSVILLTGTSRIIILSLIWGLAVAGVLFRVLWLSAPRRLYTAMYVVMGWTALWWLPQFAASGGIAIVVLVIVGGVVYSLGAVVYSRKWPNPSPKWFGFHEVFHSCTVIAAFCHWTAVLLCVLHLMS
ncbi:MAG: hemolysin III family protein [Propionibacteriaceae bacterium]|jgi:hemolysin III|nr:hemolysin III family protein [Propionibacteriaceae bacterium]